MSYSKLPIKLIAGLLLLASLAACSTKRHVVVREAYFYKASFTDLKHWEYDCHLDALQTFQKSCQRIMRNQQNNPVSKLTKLGGLVRDWAPSCEEALNNDYKTNYEARAFFEKWFIPYKVRDHKGSDIGKFTGYYEIELNGSLKKSNKYKYPIYASPKDLGNLKGKDHLSHAAINNGSLHGKKLEIAYTDNKARLFFMHIQGSGVIKLKEGGELKVGYHGENGHAYKAIGPLFKDYCDTKIASATDMMKWLHNNPKMGKKLMEENPSYIFFRKVYGDSPIGGQGVALTGERSIAIDARIYPYGLPIWVETTTPKTTHFPSFDYNRLFIAQDTGGAIKGAIRADIFYGRGNIAEELASYMNNNGSYYILLPKTVIPPKFYKAR
jgi:membrane-bound lytic murein transglycosylase A